MAIERKALRSQVRDELLERMRSGGVQPGEGINEVQLAAELGVSRTPLREALIALESEGQIESESGKGFRFVPLSAREFEELSPIIATLEGLALEMSPRDELRRIGETLSVRAAEFSDNIAQHSLVIKRDDEWHTVLLGACANQHLLELITGVRLAIHRYESLLVPDEAMVARSWLEHLEIAKCLVAGDVLGAQEALKANWLNGAHRLLTAEPATV